MDSVALIPIQEQYERSIATFQGGSEILAANELKVSQIIAAGQNIINRIQANNGQMTPELDKLCNDFIAKANTRLKEMNEARAPITQMLTAVQKLFTGIEAQLDIKKPDTVMAILQQFRNAYAKQVAEEQQRKQQEADKKARKDQEAIKIKADIDSLLARYCGDYLLAQKQALQARFNALSLDDFDEAIEKLKAFQPIYPYDHYSKFSPSISAFHHTEGEVSNIVLNVHSGRFDSFSENYKSELQGLKEQLLYRVPSKKSELIALKEADDEEKLRIADAQKKREQEEAERMALEAEEKQRQSELQAQSTAAAEETMVLFEKEAAMSVDAPAPETRNGYEIAVLQKAGFVQIFTLWWEHEGKDLPIDKLEKKTMSAMKKFCEKLAHDKDIRIESKFLTYEPIYKAINRKG